MNKIELLSPVGDFECLKAAVQSGADCVYFGGELFNARASANNFNDDELKRAIEYAKIRNVKTNLTLNILIKNEEFTDAIELAKKAYEYGIDAIIVQDLGLAKKLIELFPDLPIHASTQMTIHNLDGVLEAEKLGFKRVVLSRELSIDEIKYICDNSNIEIEVFIHGALCICYSGQCLLSSMIGGRSGNRGKCAQPCRLPYELLKVTNDINNKNCLDTTYKNINNQKDYNIDSASNYENNSISKTIDNGHLLSPKDLCSIDLLPTLVNLGITCFKIEGRLKKPEYVSTVTRIYRKYIDLAQSNEPYIVDEKDRKDLLQVFNRGGFSKGYLDPEPNQKFISKEKPNNMGIFLGTVYNFNPNKGYITLKLEDDISIGDTVSLEKEKGSYTISELMIDNKNVPTAHKGNIVKIGRIKGHINVNDKIFRMSSKSLCDLANEYVNSEKVKQNINCKITVRKNEPISMQIYTNAHDIYENIDFTITSDLVPTDSINSPITSQRIIDQVNKLGGTPFKFEKIDVDLDDNLYIPSISKLNQLRRDCIAKLEEILLEKIHRKYCKSIESAENACNKSELYNCNNNSNNSTNNSNNSFSNVRKTRKPEISVLLNILSTSENYAKLRDVDKIYIPLKYFFIPEYESKINELSTIANCYIYMPSIMKDSVMQKVSTSIESILSKFKINGFVISNISQIYLLKDYAQNYEFIGNYTLNVYNNNTIKELADLGLSCVTLSPELDKDSLNNLYSNIKKEVIVYSNIPVMTTNYCLISGSNFCLEKCNRNCTGIENEYYLKDRLNMNFRVIPDSFSKTTTIYHNRKLNIDISDINADCVRYDIWSISDI